MHSYSKALPLVAVAALVVLLLTTLTKLPSQVLELRVQHVFATRTGASYNLNAPGTHTHGGLSERHHDVASGTNATVVMASTAADDSSWLTENLPSYMDHKVYVVDDDLARHTVPVNKGNEAMVYLTYIIDHYHSLQDVSLFIHAKRYQWHNDNPDYDLLRSLRRLRVDYVKRQGYTNLRCALFIGCDGAMDLENQRPMLLYETPGPVEGEPVHPGVFKREFMRLLPDDPVPDEVSAPCCAQFGVSADVIRSRSRADYIRLQKWLIETPYDDRLSGTIFEYMWHILFGKGGQNCPSAQACYCNLYGICDLQCEEGGDCEGQVPDDWEEHHDGGFPDQWPLEDADGEPRAAHPEWIPHGNLRLAPRDAEADAQTKSGEKTSAAKPSGAKTPVAKTPGKNTPVAKTPATKTPGLKIPAAKTPAAKTPGAKTPGAINTGVKTLTAVKTPKAAKTSTAIGKTAKAKKTMLEKRVAAAASKKTREKKNEAKKTTEKKLEAKRTTEKSSEAEKTADKKTNAKKTNPAKKSDVKKTEAKKTSASKKGGAKNTAVKKTAKKTGVKKTAKKTGVKKTAKKIGVKKTARKTGVKKTAKKTGVKKTAKKTGVKKTAKKTGVKKTAKRTGVKKTRSAKRTGTKKTATAKKTTKVRRAARPRRTKAPEIHHDKTGRKHTESGIHIKRTAIEMPLDTPAIVESTVASTAMTAFLPTQA